MGVFFTEARAFPKELKSMGHYRGAFGDNSADMNAFANVVAQASPWNFLKGMFVDKPAAEAAAQAQIASTQAQLLEVQAEDRSKTLRTVAIVGAGLVGVLVLVIATRKRAPQTAGYRRRRRRR